MVLSGTSEVAPVRTGSDIRSATIHSLEEATMAKATQSTPRGYHTVTPSLIVAGAERALEFYKKALGAEELMRFPSPDGKIMHVVVGVAGPVIMLAGAMPEHGGRGPTSHGGTPVSLFVYGDIV